MNQCQKPSRSFSKEDKKAIKKIDPIICEVLKQFAQKYNYDAGSFIYNYAMSFSKNILLDIGSVPITYNFSYLNTTKLSKTEKNAISKICKNAMKNQNIDIVGDAVALTGIKYIFKKLQEIMEKRLFKKKKIQ